MASRAVGQHYSMIDRAGVGGPGYPIGGDGAPSSRTRRSTGREGVDVMDDRISMGLITLLAGGSLVMGVWDLLKRPAKDILLGVGVVEAGLVGGAVAQIFYSSGFMVGVVLGVTLGGWALIRALARRVGEDERAVFTASDGASRLLALQDRLDALGAPGGRLQRIGSGIFIGLIMLSAVGLLFIGLSYGTLIPLLLGAVMFFLPITQIARGFIEREQRSILESDLYQVERRSQERPRPERHVGTTEARETPRRED